MTDKAKSWLFLVGAIVAEVTGSLSLKGALDTPALYIIVVVIAGVLCVEFGAQAARAKNTEGA